MDDCLILLTNYFPFYKGEEYLESELPILAKKFKRIYIIATMIGNNQTQTRDVPKNVEVIVSGVSHSKINKFKMILKSFPLNPIEENKLNIPQKLYTKYFQARSEMIIKNLIVKINDYNWKQYNTITIYSYWLYITAKIGVELNKRVFKDYQTRVVSRAHRYDLYEKNTILNFLPERQYLLQNIDGIYPVSENGTEILKDIYPEYKDKISTRRLGTNDPFFKVNTTHKLLHIVSCSAIRPVKRLDLIVEAIEILQKKGIEIKWTHLGDGKDFEKIKRLANEKLLEGTYFFPGFIKNKDIFNFYKHNNISFFINVSESEGIPVSIMEAMSVGIPVLATDVGGTSEIVINEYNGVLFNKDVSKKEIATVLERLNNVNEERIKELSINAYSTWNIHYNADKNYEAFSEELLTKANGS